MAAILPPISSGRGGKQSTLTFSEYNSAASQGGKQVLKPLKKTKGKLEKERVVKQENLRSQQPALTKSATTSYRNSYKHNLCLDMLKNGFHSSFCELFTLIKRQEEDRIQAGPESVMWNQTMLVDEHDKLDMLKENLTTAETGERGDDFAVIYKARYELATYFQSTGDKWLSNYFFQTCLETGDKVDGDDGKMHAEGYCNVGLVLEDNLNYFEAEEHYEQYYHLSKDKEWKIKDGTPYHQDSMVNLYRIYQTIGNTVVSNDQEKCLEYLQKALAMAKESSQIKLIGEASYKLGMAYEKAGNGETALLHLSNFLAKCQTAGDEDGIGRACDAISKAYLRQGRVEESVKYLKQFEEVAEKSGQDKSFSKACHNLGNIFNTRGRYEEASEYFGKAYNLSRAMSDGDAINTNRVQYGISMAHKMNMLVSTHLTRSDIPCIERLVEWKSSRTDDFDKALPEVEAEEEKEVEEPAPSPTPEISEQVEPAAEVTSEETEKETEKEANDSN